ncbi:MAG TPA: cation/H(+) antiporter, partial [Paludibacter sp.]|nr:cation/H(+) antiporter [Paludibacter sp.]
NRGFTTISSTVVLLHSESDDFLLRYSRRLLRNKSEVSIFIIDVNKVLQTSEKMRKVVDELKASYPTSVKQLKSSKNNASIISKFSFMLISYQTWNNLSESDNGDLTQIPSTLIINKKPSRFSTLNKSKVIQKEIEYSEID